MANKQDTCHPERIEQFLGHRLSDEEQTAFELHLDQCNDCRHQLEQSAACEETWAGVRESLPFSNELGRYSALDSTTNDELPFSHDTVLNMLAPTDDDRMIGRLGTYEVVGVIGSGGMGIVLKALDPALSRYVAIKVLAPHLGSSGSARKRFSREAQAAAAVVHDNVIEIHGVADAGGLSYLVMPYVRGPSLQRRLDHEGPLATAEILRIGTQTAAGLAAAHAQGLVHRDVKPANILLADGVERVKLTDFGLARAADDASLTMSGIIAGTPQYMSPEQACGESIDQRSDLFSLGSVLYAMCTGRSPFRAETSYGVLRRITDDKPKPIREINAEIPDWLCQIIDRLMAKRPDERFESADEVADLLEDCLAHVQQPTTVPLPATLMTRSRGSRFYSNSHRLFGVLTMLAAFILGLLGMFLWSANPPDISGHWSGEDWGQITLEAEKPGKYTGTYTVTTNEVAGKLQIKWSRIEHRFNGNWSEGKDRFGKLSLRLVDNEIRGGWTTSRQSKINPGTPELADLLWARDAKPKSNHTNAGYPEKIALPHMQLSDVVRRFNQSKADDPIGKDQPPLTVYEVVASVRWAFWLPKHSDLRQLRGLIEDEIVPAGWQLQAVTNLEGVKGERFQAWSIRLVKQVGNGKNLTHIIRQRLLGQLDSQDQLMELPAIDESQQIANEIPLSAAIHNFNASHRSLGGQEQPPLTEREVVAAIRYWKTRRDEAPVANRDFAAFQSIADSRQLPEDVHFDFIPTFTQSDGSKYLIWSVRIRTPQTSKPGWTFAYEIRKQFVRWEPSTEVEIAWGPVAANGLQVGVRLKPQNEQYIVGQQVTPIFFYRNTSDQEQEVSFPRLMTHSYYDKIIAVDATGKAIPIDQDDKQAGPVGWIGMPFGFGAKHKINGLPIVLGEVDRGSAETVIRAEPGESVRVRFALPNYAQEDREPLQTGDIFFSIAKSKTEAVPQIDGAKQSARSVDPPTEVLDGETDPSTTSEFPHPVKFEQGATNFKDGDNITILEIRGTAGTFAPGNTYQITGIYTLASQGRATLAAYTTAKYAIDGTGPTKKVQQVDVERGKGTFTLLLPMSCEGWPHISFYPHGGGESFGGNYFGTGESVLKQWWGLKPDQKADTPTTPGTQ